MSELKRERLDEVEIIKLLDKSECSISSATYPAGKAANVLTKNSAVLDEETKEVTEQWFAQKGLLYNPDNLW